MFIERETHRQTDADKTDTDDRTTQTSKRNQQRPRHKHNTQANLISITNTHEVVHKEFCAPIDRMQQSFGPQTDLDMLLPQSQEFSRACSNSFLQNDCRSASLLLYSAPCVAVHHFCDYVAVHRCSFACDVVRSKFCSATVTPL